MAEDNHSRRVILLGATGSGKSTFISNIIGRDIGIGHRLESYTSRVQEIEVPYGGKSVVLVDTPGFDDTDIPDAIILKRIGEWLKKKSLKREELAGVIYLHKISDPRMSGSAKRNLETFKGLCGEEYSPRIAVVSTHWAEEGTRQCHQDVIRLQQFRDKWLKSLISKGSALFELKPVPFNPNQAIAPGAFDNPINPNDAKLILNHVLDIQEPQMKPRLQAEIVDQKKKIGKTTAGTVYESSIKERLGQLAEQKAGLKQAIAEGHDGSKEEFSDLKDETRQLMLNQARLQGDVVGVIVHNLGISSYS